MSVNNQMIVNILKWIGKIISGLGVLAALIYCGFQIIDWLNRKPDPVITITKWGVDEIPIQYRNEHGYQTKIYFIGCEIQNNGQKTLHSVGIDCDISFNRIGETLKRVNRIDKLMTQRDSTGFEITRLNNLQSDFSTSPDSVTRGDLAFLSTMNREELYKAIASKKAKIIFRIKTNRVDYPCEASFRSFSSQYVDVKIIDRHYNTKDSTETWTQINSNGYSKPDTIAGITLGPERTYTPPDTTKKKKPKKVH